MKILIVQIGRIGDMVLTTPLFREIHHKFQDAQIDILCSKQNFQIIEDNPHIHKTWIYVKGIQVAKLLFALRAEKYDIWLDPKDHFSRESMILAKLSNAKIKIGWKNERNSVFTHPILLVNSQNHHRVETNLTALIPMGITPQFTNIPELFPTKDSEDFVEKFLSGIDNPIVVNISAGNKSRYLPAETWRKVLENINSTVVLNFTPNDTLLAKEIKGNNPKIHLFSSRSIMDTVSLIKRARMVISPDTAVIHIASAFDIPTLGIYANIDWNFERFRPLSSHSIVIQPDEGKTLQQLSSDKILKALEQFPF